MYAIIACAAASVTSSSSVDQACSQRLDGALVQPPGGQLVEVGSDIVPLRAGERRGRDGKHRRGHMSS